jgi:sporulation protein YlmC with PRC-barrel domain
VKVVVNNTEFIKNKARINELLEKLRKKLSSFEVINFQGQRIGKIKDFTLDKNRRLYMVLPQSDDQADSSVLLLSSKYIQKVDTKNRDPFCRYQ